MKAQRKGRLRFDELTIIAGFLFLLYVIMSIAWCRRYNPGHLLWFCDIALLLTAVGLFIRNGTLVTAQLAAILVYHLGWNLDFWLFLIFGYLPVGSTAYMFYHDLSLIEKSISLFSHVFIIPAALYGVYILGAPGKSWLIQWGQTLLIFLFTYLLTRPEENINWMFGTEVINISPANFHPIFYYALMATLPPLMIYWPMNRMLTTFINRRRRRRSDRQQSCAASRCATQSVVAALPSRLSPVAVVATVILASAVSMAVARVADRKCVLDSAIFEVMKDGNTHLEALPTTKLSTPVDSITFGGREPSRQLPLLVWPHLTLPKQWSGFDNKLHAHTKSVLLEMLADDIPSAPQEVLLRGTRTVRGSVVWAYVASDDFYLQNHPDLHGDRNAYEVSCKIGGRGLSEYVNPATGELFPSTPYNEILGEGTGAIYALGVIEVLEGEIIAKSSYYLVKRRGIRFPEDIWLTRRDGMLIPLLSQPATPINSRVAFQSPFNTVNDVPEIFTCNFFGYELRNLSNSPDRFDGFVAPGGKPFAAVGWLDGNVVRYYSNREDILVQLKVKD